MKTLILVVAALFLLVPAAFAAQLGVNYYDETLMKTNGVIPFIQRTNDGIAQDMRDIKTISTHVKFFMNPFNDKNLYWVEQVNSIARNEGMSTSVTMMVDDQQLTNENWGAYRSKVINACQYLSGKTDEILVGNEITLHSPLPRDDIKNKVVALMQDCDNVFSGAVSYQEFWYAKDVWKGYNGRIYWMMYENMPSFMANMDELSNTFGTNGAIGEWGEDQLEGNQERDEEWQRTQIQQRWDKIQSSKVPIAYIFTYREPSWTGFGMLRADNSHKAYWEVFGGRPGSSPQVNQPPPPPPPPPACVPTAEVADGKDNDCDGFVDDDIPVAAPPVQQPSQQCVPTTEVRDGKDNDCDGFVDDDIPAEQPTTPPVQQPTCIPSTEIRDGKDNDCDGFVDDVVEPVPPVVQPPVVQTPQCIPTNEVRDGKDNDCDGFVDDDIKDAVQTPQCVPTTEVKDGKDNDCDGKVDEDLTVVTPTSSETTSSSGTSGSSHKKKSTKKKSTRPSIFGRSTKATIQPVAFGSNGTCDNCTRLNARGQPIVEDIVFSVDPVKHDDLTTTTLQTPLVDNEAPQLFITVEVTRNGEVSTQEVFGNG